MASVTIDRSVFIFISFHSLTKFMNKRLSKRRIRRDGEVDREGGRRTRMVEKRGDGAQMVLGVSQELGIMYSHL